MPTVPLPSLPASLTLNSLAMEFVAFSAAEPYALVAVLFSGKLPTLAAWMMT